MPATAAETIQYHNVVISDTNVNPIQPVGKLEIGILLNSSKHPTALCLSAVGGEKERSPAWETKKAVGQMFHKNGAAGIVVAFQIDEEAKVSTSFLLISLLFISGTDFPSPSSSLP